MNKRTLPHQNGKSFITDGGLETTLIFHEGIDLPHFAAFDLLSKDQYLPVLNNYYRNYMDLAVKHKTGFVLESATWRSNPDYGYMMGYSEKDLDEVNQKAINQLSILRTEYENEDSPMVISGCIGPRGDGYSPDFQMSVEEARDYHMAQIRSFRDAGADMVSAITMNYLEEALGIVQAAKSLSIPVVISFTVETDGKLPSGLELGEAIRITDRETGDYPSYYMINCAHPSHFDFVLEGNWTERIYGVRANSSCKSHAELDEATELDEGNPQELANDYKILKQRLPNLKVMGGCCGTDHRHIEMICEQVL